jgi:hypothetical protein
MLRIEKITPAGGIEDSGRVKPEGEEGKRDSNAAAKLIEHPLAVPANQCRQPFQINTPENLECRRR